MQSTYITVFTGALSRTNNSTVYAFTNLSLPQHLFHSEPHLCVLITTMTNSEPAVVTFCIFWAVYQVPFIFLLPQDENYASW